MGIDARTSPRWLQPLQILFLVGLSVAFFDASFHALDRPSFYQYLMGWKMFTMKSTNGTDHRAFVQRQAGGPFEPIDLHSYFPARWGSGYRYSRFRDKGRLAVVAGALCHRLEEPAHAVRIEQMRWTLVAGSVERKREHVDLTIDHPCTRTVRMAGRRAVPLHPAIEAQRKARSK
jgi:hypothetical protein